MKKWRCVKNWCKNVGGDASVCRSACACCQAILDRVECGLKNGGKAIALERKSRAEAGGRRGGISAGRANAASFNREKQIDSACSMPRSTNGWMDGVGGTRKSSALLVRPLDGVTPSHYRTRHLRKSPTRQTQSERHANNPRRTDDRYVTIKSLSLF